MHKCFLTVTFILGIISLELNAQTIPPDRCVRDSLFRIKPHDNLVQQAFIYLEMAEQMKDYLPDKSFSYIIKAFKISILEKDNSLKAKAMIQMGDFYAFKRRFLLAHERYLSAAKIYQSIKDTAGEGNALLYVGVLNRLLNADYKSVAYLKMGLVLAQKIHDKALCSKIYDQLGLTFQMMGYDRTAMLYFNRALVLTRKIGNRLGELCVYKNIGNFYLSGKRDEEALKYFTWLLQETGQSSPDLTGSIYSCIGHIYSTKKDYRSSLDYNLKALKIRQIGKIPVSVNSSLINIAGDYFNLEKPDSGKIYMDSGLILANRYGRKSYIENGYRHLYNYYNNQGNYKKALECYARFNSVHDEIIREQNKNNIAILEALQRIQGIQQTGKKFATEHVINSLNLKFHIYQTSVLKILIWAAGLSMVFFVLSLLYIRRGRRKMQKLHLQLSDEILEREAMEVHTRENETQYKFITDNSVDFITHLDHEKNRIYASPASLRVYGYEPEEIINKSPYDLTIPLFHALAETKFTEMVETKSARQFICQAQKKDGTVFWAESILHPLFDPVSGVFKGIVGVTRDIQERKTKEIEIMEGTKQKEILLKEIHHRVKNNFAILVSLINMQVAQTKNPELVQSLTNLQLRIRTMSLVHEMLYRSNDFEKISFPGYLRSLASVIAGTYNRRDILLTVEADEVVMDIEASIPLGLIINEILSNSFKHGFPDGRAGRISIIFQVDPKNGCQTLTLQDDGIGMPDGVKLDQFKTMGLQVVQILCTQIEARLVVANGPGTCFTITFHELER